jgi:hypothetical protein
MLWTTAIASIENQMISVKTMKNEGKVFTDGGSPFKIGIINNFYPSLICTLLKERSHTVIFLDKIFSIASAALR